MIPAYDIVYLDKAQMTLGRMLDFAVYDLGYDLAAFFDLFLTSGVAELFAVGDFTVTVGRSGIELAYLVLEKSSMEVERISPNIPMNRSVEYWTGWAIAYYQWVSGLTFEEIVAVVPIDDIAALYHPYHEMDIRQFVDRMNEEMQTV